MVDLFLLKLTSLVVCRGNHSDKTNSFVKLLLAHTEAKHRDKYEIYYEDVQFVRAIRFIFYFNVIFPRRYMNDYKVNKNVFLDILFHQTN